MRGDINCNDDGTSLATVFVGRKISNDVFTLPIEAWLVGGVARRFENDLQKDFWGGVIAFTAIYRRFPLSKQVETPFGLADGLSYADKIPWLEQEKGAETDRRTSHLNHYLDVSLDVSVGDVFGADELKNRFFVFSIHHRSGIFASSNVYGNLYGGSNVNSMHLEWEFDGWKVPGAGVYDAVARSSSSIRINASSRDVPQTAGSGINLRHVAGQLGVPHILQRRVPRLRFVQTTPAGLPRGMPGSGWLMDGAMQHAAQPSRQFMELIVT